jgi:hypothetical protein
MTDHEHSTIEAVLRDLGGRLAVPSPPDPAELADAVLARLDEPRRRQFLASPLAKAAAVVLVVLLAFGLLITVSPPVRAGVSHLLRFAGIELSSDSGPTGPLPRSPAPLPGERTSDLSAAQRLSRFPVAVPSALGAPEEVRLIDGTPPRVVSLLYRGGTVRLDEFDGVADLGLFKKLDTQDFEYLQVGGGNAVWVPGPHPLYYVDRDGKYRTESARLSARTLIWQRGDVTLRLEGEFTQEQAVEIADSVR